MSRPLLMFLLVIFAGSQVVWGQGYSPQESVQRMKVPPGFKVELVASEPQVRQPIFVKFDDRGRLWTIQYLQYPNPAGLKRVKVDRWSRTVYDRVPEPPPKGPRGADKLTVLIDQNHDGHVDEVKDVVTGLNLCTGLEFGHGGLFVLQVPYLLFYPDKNGDDVIDGDPEVLLTGFGMEDAQSFANHLTWGPDGWLYGVNGSTTTCHIRGLEFQQGVWRYHPITREFELFCEGGGNLYGMTFDAEGNLLYSGNGGYLCFHALQGAYYLKSFGKHGPLHNPYTYGYFNDIDKKGSVPGGPSTGATIYFPNTSIQRTKDKGQRTSGYPATFDGALISGNFLGHTISWWKLSPLGATFSARNEGLLLDSQDTWCCPTDVCLGPDGAIYWCDFYDQRTAHPDPDANWDVTNGRIYRIVADGTERAKPVELRGMTSAELVEQLKQPGWYANRARTILAERQDKSVLPDLKQRLASEQDPLRALQYLWALNVSSGLDEPIADQLLDHPAPAVRRWAVRLLGDPQKVDTTTGEHLARLAAKEEDLTVRTQLAATAKRLPEFSLPILFALLQKTPDQVDPYLSMMLWWGLESQAVKQRPGIIAELAKLEHYQQPAFQFQQEKLVRRYAAEGHRADYDACATLLQDGKCPADIQPRLEAALKLGLAERAQSLIGIGNGDLLSTYSATEQTQQPAAKVEVDPVSGPLLDIIRSRFQQPAHSIDVDYLAMLSGDARLKQEFLQLVAALKPEQLKPRLPVVEAYGDEQFVPVVLPLLKTDLRLAAIKILAKFDHPEIVPQLLDLYPKLKEDEKRAVQELCLRRPAGTLALLKQIDVKKIPAAEVSLDLMRLVALHGDEDLNALVRKHWGNLQPGTSEEKLATVRRFKNDLRAAKGNAANGKILFTKHCATCHKLFNEGGAVGPDLNPANRGDQDFLLVSTVDPSSVIRSQFMNYVLATKSGAILQGVLADQDAASVTLVDAKAQKHKIERSEIEDFKESTASLMPEKLLEPLSPQELRDLFSYLQQPTMK